MSKTGSISDLNDRAEKAEIEATISPDKMKRLLEVEGFSVQGLYSDFQYSEYGSGEHCIVVAKKVEE